MSRRIKEKTTRRKNTPVKRRNQYVKRRKGSVKRINKTSKRNKFSKRTNMKHGGFKIYKDEVIGKGGQGTAIMKVFEIEENDAIADAAWVHAGPILSTDVGKKVCFVKKIYPDFMKKISTGTKAMEALEDSLMTEISLMIELDHVNIIKLYSYAFEGDRTGDPSPYIIMDYFNCIDLKHMIQEKALVAKEPGGGCSKNTLSDKIGLRKHPAAWRAAGEDDPPRAKRDLPETGSLSVPLFGGGTKRWGVYDSNKLFIIKEIFAGIQYLHMKKIIHRDIKPENIFLNVDPEQKQHIRVVIGDLGLAIQVDDINSDHLMKKGGLEEVGRWAAGTTPYIPNESKSKSLLTQDYYAFGVVVLQVILMDDITKNVRSRTNFHDLYLRYISDDTEKLGAYEPLLTRLLYQPPDGEEYPPILKKRREAFEEIGSHTLASGVAQAAAEAQAAEAQAAEAQAAA
jgi:serine/threonine protein kinase